MPEKKKSQKMGRDKDKCAAYRLNKTREKHKIVRIRKSNGEKAALKYASDHGLLPFALKRLAPYARTKENQHVRSGSHRPAGS